MAEQDLARQWLRENGYEEIADLIDNFILEWKAAGKRTRRNWWEMLAGGSQGNPRTINGKEFPVLRAAQIRQGLPVTPNAIWRSEENAPPPAPRVTGRWPKRRRKSARQTVKNRPRVVKSGTSHRIHGDLPRRA
jgi:hypothetical protein